jgi:hypothetical protein
MDQEIVRFERTGCWLQWYAVTPAKLCRRLAEATLQSYLGTRFRRIPPVSDGENSQFPKMPIQGHNPDIAGGSQDAIESSQQNAACIVCGTRENPTCASAS